MIYDIHSALGVPRKQPGKTLITTGPGEAGCPLFGPYIDLPPGRYSVAFEIRASDPPAPVPPSAICGHVDVCGRGGALVLASQAFSSADLAMTDGRLELDFTVTASDAFEFRVFGNGICGLDVTMERRLTADRDVFTNYGSGAQPPANPGGAVTCSGFFLNNVRYLSQLGASGARIATTEDGALITLAGVTMHAQNVEDFQLIWEVLLHPGYNFLCSDDVCVIDVGMNIGLASLYFAQFDFVKEVHSFEPFKAPYDRALANIALNPAFGGKITPHNLGLAAEAAQPVVGYDESFTIGASIRGGGSTQVSLDIRDGGEVFARIIAQAKAKGLKIVAKVDCEGSEFPIFERLVERDLLQHISIIVMEWHKWWSDQKTSRELIEPMLANDFIVIDHTNPFDPYAGQMFAVRSDP